VLLQTSSLDSFSDLRLSGSCKLDTTDCASHHSAAALLAPARKACESAQEKYVWYSRIISASLIRRKQEPGEPEIRHHRVRGRGLYPPLCTYYFWSEHLVHDALAGVLRSPRYAARTTQPSSASCFRISSPICLLNSLLRSLSGVQDRYLFSSSMSVKS